MQFKCEGCGEIFENEDSLEVFADIPAVVQKIGHDGITFCGECPLCGGIVYPMEEELPAHDIHTVAG